MDLENLKSLKKIKLSDNVKKNIMQKCNSEISKQEEYKLKKSFKKPAAFAAALAACLCLSITALAISGTLGGFFEDIIGFGGAIIGTRYQQATEEINVTVSTLETQLIVKSEFLKAEAPPYFTFEEFGINSYEIIDADGNVIISNTASDFTTVNNGCSEIHIDISSLEHGNYSLLIHSFVGSSKAEQPLVIYGEWNCVFDY